MRMYYIGLSGKLRDLGVFGLLFKTDLCSAISFKRSRRELSIDVTEHRSIFKNKGVKRILVTFQDRPTGCSSISLPNEIG